MNALNINFINPKFNASIGEFSIESVEFNYS